MIVYLCGAINGCSDAECKDWREKVKAAIPQETLDPMRRDYRGAEDTEFKSIVEGDKADVEASDLILVVSDRPSSGTDMEILYAWEAEKEIWLVTTPQARLSPWRRYHVSRIFYDLDEAIEELASLA